MGRFVRTLFLFVVTFLGCFASAQMIPPETVDSIDAKVMNSGTIAVGSIGSIPNPDDPKIETVVLDLKEVLRGKSEPRVTASIIVPYVNQPRYQWPKTVDLRYLAQSHAPLLIFRDDRENGYRLVELQHSTLPVATADFEILDTSEKILAYVKALIRKRPNEIAAGRAKSYLPPESPEEKSWRAKTRGYGYGGLVVPIDERLEKRGFAMLEIATRRYMGLPVQMLTPFKSDANIARVRRYLTDPRFEVVIKAEEYNGLEYRDFTQRAIGQQLLKAWDVPAPEAELRQLFSRRAEIQKLKTWPGGDYGPDIRWLDEAKRLTNLQIVYGTLSDEEFGLIARHTQLTDLGLNRTHTDDNRLKQLGGLTNLRVLNLDSNPVTDEAVLDLVRHLPKLQEIRVAATRMTDAGIAQLKARAGLTVVTEKSPEEPS